MKTNLTKLFISSVQLSFIIHLTLLSFSLKAKDIPLNGRGFSKHIIKGSVLLKNDSMIELFDCSALSKEGNRNYSFKPYCDNFEISKDGLHITTYHFDKKSGLTVWIYTRSPEGWKISLPYKLKEIDSTWERVELFFSSNRDRVVIRPNRKPYYDRLAVLDHSDFTLKLLPGKPYPFRVGSSERITSVGYTDDLQFVYATHTVPFADSFLDFYPYPYVRSLVWDGNRTIKGSMISGDNAHDLSSYVDKDDNLHLTKYLKGKFYNIMIPNFSLRLKNLHIFSKGESFKLFDFESRKFISGNFKTGTVSFPFAVPEDISIRSLNWSEDGNYTLLTSTYNSINDSREYLLFNWKTGKPMTYTVPKDYINASGHRYHLHRAPSCFSNDIIYDITFYSNIALNASALVDRDSGELLLETLPGSNLSFINKYGDVLLKSQDDYLFPKNYLYNKSFMIFTKL